MCKKWRSCVLSLVCLFCMSFTLFLNTLHVSASSSTNSSWDLLGSAVIDESMKQYTVKFKWVPTFDDTHVSSGTTSNSGEYVASGGGQLTGTISLNNGSISLSPSHSNDERIYGSISGYVSSSGSASLGFQGAYVEKHNPNYNGSLTGGSGSVTMSGGGANYTELSSGSMTFNTIGRNRTQLHLKIPIDGFFPIADGVTIKPNDYYGVFHGLTSTSIQINDADASVENLRIIDSNDNIITFPTASNRNVKYYTGSELLGVNTSNQTIGFPMFVEFDYIRQVLSTDNGGECTLTFNLYPRIRTVKSDYQSYVGSNMSSDPKTHELQEESNEIASDTNETTHSIFDSLTDFFGSFFDNLIHVFVPEDGYFTSWFNRLNQLLTDKLGILYYPFGYLISFLTEILDICNQYEGDVQHCYIEFPAIEFPNRATGETYHLTDAQTVDLASFNVAINNNAYVQSINSRFTTLLASIRIFNDVVVIFALITLSYRKLSLIFSGDERSGS